MKWKAIGKRAAKAGGNLCAWALTAVVFCGTVSEWAVSSAWAANERTVNVDPGALLRGVREAQASIKQTLQGKLSKGAKSISYRLIMDGPRVRFEFPSAVPPAPSVVTLHFWEKSSSLEVATAEGGHQKVKFSDEIANLGVCYEDLSLRFLYWGDATIEGEETLMLAKCWKVRVRRPKGVSSPYKEVVVWISQQSPAFLKSEAFGEDDRLLRRLTVRQVQSLDQVTTLKQLRIESPGSDKTPTYLYVDGQANARPPK
jgi:hypothetical protein